MLRSDAVTLIQQQLGFRSDLEDAIVTNLKRAQEMLENGPTKPWFLVSEDSYIDTTATEPRLPLPTDFLQETDTAVLRYVPATLTDGEVDLKKDDFDVLRKNFFNQLTGTIKTGPPEAYALQGSYFWLFPVPDAEYRIRQVYYKRDTTLSSDVENGWLKWVPFLLIGKAGGMIASALRDAAAVGIFQKWENEGRLVLVSQETDRAMANRDMQIGGPH